MVRCKAKTLNNRRCKLHATLEDGVYCHIHIENFRNYTNKYCNYEIIGPIDTNINIYELVDTDEIKLDNPFYSFTILLYNFKYIIPEYKSYIDRINNQQLILSSFSDTGKIKKEYYTVENLIGMHDIIKSFDSILTRDIKSIYIVSQCEILPSEILKKYRLDDIYETFHSINFYLEHTLYHISFYNTIVNIQEYIKRQNKQICFELYNKLIECKKNIIKLIQDINRYQSEKKHILRLLSKTKLPNDVVMFCIAPFI